MMANSRFIKTLGHLLFFFSIPISMQQPLYAAAYNVQEPLVHMSDKPILWSCDDVLAGKCITVPLAKLVPQGPQLGNKPCVRFKTAKDAQVYLSTEQLIDALKNNKPEACKRLLAEGANPALCMPCFGESPIVLAAAHAMTDTVRLLIEHKADVHAGGLYRLYEKDTALCALLRRFRSVLPACGYAHVREVLNMLIDAGADPAQQGLDNEEPLVVLAAAEGIPNKVAFPIIHDLFVRCANHNALEEMRAKAVAAAQARQKLVDGKCPDHVAMFHARAYFIQHYPGLHINRQSLFQAVCSLGDTAEKNVALQEIELYKQTGPAAQKEVEELMQDCLGCWMIKPWQPTQLDNPIYSFYPKDSASLTAEAMMHWFH